MSKISVIMTSYNKPAFAGKVIRSVLEQTEKNFELLLMDDNSDEETVRSIEACLHDRRVRCFRSTVASVAERAAAVRYAVLINEAIGQASGEYITYLTDDNVCRPHKLERLSAYLDRNPGADIVYSASLTHHIRDDGSIVKSVHRPASRLTWCAPCAVDHCSVMHRRSILSDVYEQWGSYWDEDPAYYRIGDARFFWRLNHFRPFHPLDEVLDDNYMTERSLHSQLFSQEPSEFVRLLPEQANCRDLREYLRLRQAGSRG